ncbi:MAG: polymer-forming cytoskeletal protein [Gemmatimonadetes bacterium]|nr:MAG: polymer-forming cytoskeletal protein [Gemmatimonadota bacterium]
MQSLISKGIKVTGEMTSDEDITIEGEFEGKIKVNGKFHIGRNGRVTAEVEGTIVSVEGKVVGNIFAKEKVHIHASGRVEGDIECPTGGLEVDPEAIIRGKVNMKEREVPAYLSDQPKGTSGGGSSAGNTPSSGGQSTSRKRK